MKDESDRENADGRMTTRRWQVFGAGLGVYILGFFLLAYNHPDLAPAVIVWGILVMLGAFFC